MVKAMDVRLIDNVVLWVKHIKLEPRNIHIAVFIRIMKLKFAM